MLLFLKKTFTSKKGEKGNCVIQNPILFLLFLQVSVAIVELPKLLMVASDLSLQPTETVLFSAAEFSPLIRAWFGTEMTFGA